MPAPLESGKWDKTPAGEAKAGKLTRLLPFSKKRQAEIKADLLAWWLAGKGRANTPNWDIASACRVKGKLGLLLVEAKAHRKELYPKSDQCGSTNKDNRDRIQSAIAEANASLQSATGNPWNLSCDDHPTGLPGLGNWQTWAFRLCWCIWGS